MNVGKLTFEQLSTAVLAWGSNMNDDVGSPLCGVDDLMSFRASSVNALCSSLHSGRSKGSSQN